MLTTLSHTHTQKVFYSIDTFSLTKGGANFIKAELISKSAKILSKIFYLENIKN